MLRSAAAGRAGGGGHGEEARGGLLSSGGSGMKLLVSSRLLGGGNPSWHLAGSWQNTGLEGRSLHHGRPPDSELAAAAALRGFTLEVVRLYVYLSSVFVSFVVSVCVYFCGFLRVFVCVCLSARVGLLSGRVLAVHLCVHSLVCGAREIIEFIPSTFSAPKQNLFSRLSLLQSFPNPHLSPSSPPLLPNSLLSPPIGCGTGVFEAS